MPIVSINNHPMYYEVHGEGEPLLAMGGFPLITGHGFNSLPAQVRENFQILTFDHRGFGQSGDDGSPPSTALYARDAAGLIEHLGWKKVHLLAAGGLGACVGQHLAGNRQDLIHDVVLAAGWKSPEPFHHAQQRLMIMLRGLDYTKFYSLFTGLLVFPPEGFTDELVEARLKSADAQAGTWKGRKEAHLRLLQANYEHDATAVLGNIKCPALVTCGEFDALGGPRLAKPLADAIPGSRFEILRNIGHIYAANPAVFKTYGTMIETFFKSHPIRS